jgi:hypothetical protein
VCRKYIKSHPGETLKEIGTAFKVSDASILYRIRQFRIVDKKIILYQKQDKAKGRKFTKFLDQKPIKDLVFIDKSGINHQDINEHA